MILEYKDLVWKEKGFVLEKSELFENEQDETFWGGKTLDLALKGITKKVTVWFCSRFPEEFFYEEEKALETQMDYASSEVDEDSDEWKLLSKRLNELSGVRKK